ncbi:MAG: hypothetical protein AAFN41_09735, partial [Planctomycetota bacterium]
GSYTLTGTIGQPDASATLERVPPPLSMVERVISKGWAVAVPAARTHPVASARFMTSSCLPKASAVVG